MNNKESLLKEFAHLAVEVGVNVQPGQLLVINAPIVAKDLVEMIAKRAYEVGAGRVMVNWQDDFSSKLFYEYASDERLTEVPEFTIERLKYIVAEKGAVISITSPNPEMLKDVDPKKIALASNASAPKYKFYSEHMMASKSQWSIIAYPNEAWAHKVFPELNKGEAVEKLLEAILYTSRVDANSDAVENWKNHMHNLDVHNQILNDYNFKSLHFKNSLGTDLDIELVENHIWAGGGELSGDGIFFVPNIPTEENFTMPHNQKINGTVVSTKPLNVRGKVIPEFKLTFKDGRVVDFEAKEEYETLKTLLETDEGSKNLGEVALVSYDSPISNLNILFYNTLFDENASCHLALGNAYSMNIKNGTNMTEEELKKFGYNVSNIHVDFMFGSRDMEIVGTTHTGEKVTIFRKGNFVI
ncbi:MAG: aminopeptidase [Mollicutes bacterium]|nr:aminopeptidase [Mollicutes bacterium]